VGLVFDWKGLVLRLCMSPCLVLETKVQDPVLDSKVLVLVVVLETKAVALVLVLVICPIAMACSMVRIIKSVCVCQCVRLWALSRSHFLIDFHKNWHKRSYPKSKMEFVGDQYRTTPSPILPPKTPTLGHEVLKVCANIE